MRIRHISGAVTVAVLALGAAACGGGESGGTADGELEKTQLTVGSLPLADYAALYWAEEKGFFEDEGLDVTIVGVAALVEPGLLVEVEAEGVIA